MLGIFIVSFGNWRLRLASFEIKTWECQYGFALGCKTFFDMKELQSLAEKEAWLLTEDADRSEDST